MTSLITSDIRISVEPRYEPQHSDPDAGKFLFSYQITIENLSNHRVKLLSRLWHIFDSTGFHRKVEGEGVVGQQPLLAPGQIHQYASWCPLTSSMGRMQGHFNMVRLTDDYAFSVIIPAFDLVASFRLN